MRALLTRVRDLFDVDHNPASLPRSARGVRIPGAWDTFETAVSVIAGQVVSTASARAAMAKIQERFGEPGKFPGASRLRQADLSKYGLTRTKARAVQALAAAVESGEVRLSRASPLAETRAALSALPGLGPWTTELIALRCLGDTDAFPTSDLAVARALQTGEQNPEKWRPWRGYLTLLLWKKHSSKGKK